MCSAAGMLAVGHQWNMLLMTGAQFKEDDLTSSFLAMCSFFDEVLLFFKVSECGAWWYLCPTCPINIAWLRPWIYTFLHRICSQVVNNGSVFSSCPCTLSFTCWRLQFRKKFLFSFGSSLFRRYPPWLPAENLFSSLHLKTIISIHTLHSKISKAKKNHSLSSD